MKKTIITFIMLSCFIALHSQEGTTEINPFALKIGLGLGNKSHYGNYGVTANLFLTKNISAKLSVGTSVFNKGGETISIGPEFSFLNSNTGFFSLGTLWSYIGEGFDIFGDEDSNDYIFYHTSNMTNIKSYFGYTFRLNKYNLTVEGGYSYALKEYSYYFTGPGTPTQKEHDSLKRGLSSGWMACIYFNVFWPKKTKLLLTSL